MPVSTVKSIASAIEAGFKLIAQVLSGSESRRMRSAIEYGEKFIRRYERITPREKRDKTLQKYIKKFFKYNN